MKKQNTYKDFINDKFLNKKVKIKTNYINNKNESGQLIIGEVIKIYFFEDFYEGDSVSLDIKNDNGEIKQFGLTLRTHIEFLD